MYLRGQNEMWKKVWAWIKKYSHIIVLAIGSVVGFIFGRRSNGGTVADFERLRNDYAELKREYDKLADEIVRLGELKDVSDATIARLEEEFIRDGIILDDVGKQIKSGRYQVSELEQANERLRNWIQKYGAQIKGISSDK